MIYFGMVTTSNSRRYTSFALDSFFRHSNLSAGDRFLLIDNDGDFSLPESYPRVELIRCERPRSFAANVNSVMRQAAPVQADVVFLNNDIVFAPGWLAPLCAVDQAILLPMCNQHVTYQRGGLELKSEMDLEQYAGNEEAFLAIVAGHHADPRMRGFLRPMHVSFYCFRLPFLVYSRLGLFDESFGSGGAEDTDYRIRAYLAGFDIGVVAESYVLHFNGKSTWRGGETPDESRAREARYIDSFRAKWGDDLAKLFILNPHWQHWERHAAAIGVEEMIKSGDYRQVINACLSRRQTAPDPVPVRQSD
jgi:GT2 family glycosyltransferase